MSLLDDCQAILTEVIAGISSQTTDRSIKKAAVADPLNDIVAILQKLITTGIIPLTGGGTNPKVITTWQSAYFSQYGNGEFLVQLVDENNNLQDRPDIGITRIINRSGSMPVQTGISLDMPGYPNGQIIIKYSNLPLL